MVAADNGCIGAKRFDRGQAWISGLWVASLPDTWNAQAMPCHRRTDSSFPAKSGLRDRGFDATAMQASATAS